MVLIAALSVVWFTAYVLTQLVVFAARPEISRASVQRNALIICLCGLLLSVIAIAGPDKVILSCVYTTTFYFCLFVLYTPFYYTLAASMSVQSMIIILRNSLSHNDTELAELYSKFASKDLVKTRLDVMTQNKYLICVDGKYTLAPKGRAFATFFGFIKRIWRLGSGG